MSSDEDPSAGEPPSLSVLAECTQIVFKQRPGSLLSHVPVALLALAIGWEREVRFSNLAFVGLLLFYVYFGIHSARSFNTRPTTDASARRAARELFLSLAALGVVYNLIFLNLDRHGVEHALDYQLLVLALFSAGAAASYQHLRGLAVVFIVFSVVPLAAWQFLRGGQKGHVTAVLLAVFVVFMSRVSLGLHEEAIERLILTRQLKAAKEEAERLARVDSLTGLLNRRAFYEIGAALLAGAIRHDHTLSLMMIDLDHFKSINDRFGHSAGDTTLVAFAETLRKAQRASDVCARLGGEEFAVMLPETSAASAALFAARLREELRNIHFAVTGSAGLTASFGIAERGPDGSTLDSLIDRADRALYRAKAEGRDRAVIEGPRP